MHNHHRAAWLRLFLFLLLPVLAVSFANRFLVQTDAVTAQTMHEMGKRSDIDLALVGSSVVRNQFDAQRITQRTGLETFNASSPCLTLPGSIAITDQLFDTNHPETVVLFLEHDTFSSDIENSEALIRLMPFLRNPVRRLRYYLDTSAQDSQYFMRLFTFRLIGAQGLDDVKKTFALHTDPEGYLAAHPGLDEFGTSFYHGRGFMDVTEDTDIDAFLREQRFDGTKYPTPRQISAYARARLLNYKALCERNGARLVVFFSPLMTARCIAERDFAAMRKSVRDFLTENGFEAYDLALAKESILPNLDEYYLDFFHVNNEGAAILSDAFADMMTRILAGENISSDFYTSDEEKLDDLRGVTNVWATAKRQSGALTLTARSNHGAVPVRYRFVRVAGNGSEELLRDWSEDASLSLPDDAKGTLRVYAAAEDDFAWEADSPHAHRAHKQPIVWDEISLP